jgi:hypothetical protein
MSAFQEFAPLNLKLIVYDTQSGEAIREHLIDYNSPQTRRWLMRVTLWATYNHKSIELINVNDDKTVDRPE